MIQVIFAAYIDYCMVKRLKALKADRALMDAHDVGWGCLGGVTCLAARVMAVFVASFDDLNGGGAGKWMMEVTVTAVPLYYHTQMYLCITHDSAAPRT